MREIAGAARPGGRSAGSRRTEPIGDGLHGSGQIAGDGVAGVGGGSPKQGHDDQRPVRSYEKVYQEMLVHPVDLSQEAPYAVALHARRRAATRRKADLEGNVVPRLRPIDDAIQKADAARRQGPNVIATAVEERPD